MRSGTLELITLHSWDGECGPVERLPASLQVELDISHLAVKNLGTTHVEVLVGFDCVLSPMGSEELVCDIEAVFRLLYRHPPLKTVARRKEFATRQATFDAWPFWYSHLTYVIAMIGLAQLRVSPHPPRGTIESAEEMFEICRKLDQKARAREA